MPLPPSPRPAARPTRPRPHRDRTSPCRRAWRPARAPRSPRVVQHARACPRTTPRDRWDGRRRRGPTPAPRRPARAWRGSVLSRRRRRPSSSSGGRQRLAGPLDAVVVHVEMGDHPQRRRERSRPASTPSRPETRRAPRAGRGCRQITMLVRTMSGRAPASGQRSATPRPTAGRADGRRASRSTIVVEGDQPGGRDHAGLAHAAAEALTAPPARSAMTSAGPASNEPTGRRGPSTCSTSRWWPTARTRRRGVPRGDLGVEQPRAVEVHGQAARRDLPRAARAARARRRRHVGVLDTHERQLG